MLLCDENRKENKVPTKEKKLYITYIVKKRKAGKNSYKRAQKKAT